LFDIDQIFEFMRLIDTHAHLYLEEFKAALGAIEDRARSVGAARTILPAIDSSTHAMMLELEAGNPANYISMIGLHPCSVKGNYEEELRIIERYLTERRFIAVGEIGLDFHWDLTYKEQQYVAFRRQIEYALEYNIPIAIHSRDATDECIEVIKEYGDRGLRGVFHCFSGTVAQAKEVMGQGFYLGIGGVVTFKNGGLDKVLGEIDLSKVVLETDAPYLAPVPFRGKRNETSYLKYVVEKIAMIKGISEEEVAGITTRNAENLFGL
jgi:TatD DNase family protein